jgi:hypothetical protein
MIITSYWPFNTKRTGAIKSTLACQPALARRHRNIIMLCNDYRIHTYKPTLSKPGLGQGLAVENWKMKMNYQQFLLRLEEQHREENQKTNKYILTIEYESWVFQ